MLSMILPFRSDWSAMAEYSAFRPVQTAPEVESRLFDLFSRHHARIVVGVIPCSAL